MSAVTLKKVGILMGGTSPEREISLRSGNAVFNALHASGYDVVALDVGHDICDLLRRERIEIAFLVLHGGYGENGGIQGLLEVMAIPYTGSGVLASAIAMDKEASKKMFIYHGIPVPPFLVLTSADVYSSEKEKSSTSPLQHSVLSDFDLPWVIKPVTEGSSIGVTIIREESFLYDALHKALKFGDRVLVERYIEGKEVQVGILNRKVLGAVEVRPKPDFYSYEAKYTAGLTEYILPPDVQSNVLHRAEETALAAHGALSCRGTTRVDMIIDRAGNPFVLEVNTIPGMTETSLLPKIALQSGLDFTSLVETILEDALKGGNRG